MLFIILLFSWSQVFADTAFLTTTDPADSGPDQSSEITRAADAGAPATASIFQQCKKQQEHKDFCLDNKVSDGQDPRKRCAGALKAYSDCLAGAKREDSAFTGVQTYNQPETEQRTAYVNGSANCKRRINDTMTCLICNCHNEAGIEGTEGKVQVNRTVLARVASRHYPNNICSVIWQRAQFSWTLPRIREENVVGRHYNACYHAAKTALAKGSNGACFYHGTYIRPYWARNKRVANVGRNGVLGRHKFYKC